MPRSMVWGWACIVACFVDSIWANCHLLDLFEGGEEAPRQPRRVRLKDEKGPSTVPVDTPSTDATVDTYVEPEIPF